MTIGIPKAFIYWKRPYFWEEFFKNLGFEVLLSPKTNQEIVETGTKISDPETCFSNKVYFGHLKWLEGKVDLIFVPRLKTNKEKLEYCPKFFGLSDLAKIFLKTKILTQEFDERKKSFLESLLDLGKKLKKEKKKVLAAFEKANSKEKEMVEKREKEALEKLKSNSKKIILISHPYNLYDDYVNLRIGERIEKLGFSPIFLEDLRAGKKDLKRWPNFHWEFGKEIAQKIEKILECNISGAAEISSFACGCDAVLKEFVERRFKEEKIPFLYLIIDEHTGEAGFQTRIEAFLDTVKK